MTLLPLRLGPWIAGLLAVAAVGCSHAPPTIEPAQLLRDDLFAAPAVRIDARDVLALSEPMRRYADAALLGSQARRDRRRALIEALYQREGLLLGYDTELTRTAAEAFEQRAGNCLSLTVMTAAFARYLELPVQFQAVQVDEEYSRAGDLFLAAGHVNVVVGRQGTLLDANDTQWLTIDFLPQADLRHQRATPVGEQTIQSMFMNNRAAEALAAGRIDESYWWAREAVRQDPGFLAAANTLAVIYSRAGHPAEAERALRFVLEREPDHLSALANLARLLESGGRHAEAAPLTARLAARQPHPPLWFFDRGREALERREFAAARDLFQRELRRQPQQHEVHFHLALAFAGLNDAESAARHLALAMVHSPTRGAQALYAGKLDRLRAQHLQ
jgi:tetratricopeptide (TPR) repeat protein